MWAPPSLAPMCTRGLASMAPMRPVSSWPAAGGQEGDVEAVLQREVDQGQGGRFAALGGDLAEGAADQAAGAASPPRTIR